MYYRHLSNPKSAWKTPWFRISHHKFFSDNNLTTQYRQGLIEIKHQPPKTAKQLAQWNRFQAMGHLSRTAAGIHNVLNIQEVIDRLSTSEFTTLSEAFAVLKNLEYKIREGG